MVLSFIGRKMTPAAVCSADFSILCSDPDTGNTEYSAPLPGPAVTQSLYMEKENCSIEKKKKERTELRFRAKSSFYMQHFCF